MKKRYDFNRYFGSVFFPNLSKIQEEKRETVMSFAMNCPDELYGYLSGLGVDKCLDLLHTFKMTYTNQHLHAAALHLVSEILVATDHAMEKEKVTPEQLREAEKTIYLPDEDGILASSVQLCFTDIHERSTRTTTHKVKLVHNCVSRRTVIGLGVKNRRDQMIDTFSTGLPFGQSEDLTNAIKRVLHAYPDDHAILKELIQNADDAKATKIHFIWDPRTHSSENLFSESWKHLQGPALCVHSNSPFTQEDVEAIQNFGIGSKGGDPSKTGQYGIGFCSVFHLTDVPSILTSGPDLPETLCVFDPHCTFVPGATKQKPGRQYKHLSELREEFQDVFSCFLGEHFETENATMMRIPLRNAAVAAKSKICSTEPHSMLNILQKLEAESAKILLFVNHLQEIEISKINERTGGLVTIYSVKSQVRKDDLVTAQHMDGQAAMAKMVEEAIANMKLQGFDITYIPRKTTVTMLNIDDSRKEKQTYCVAQCIGIDDDTNLPSSVEEAINDGSLALLPRGGVAARVDRSFSPFESNVFCFLPMPVTTELPVHVNGHFALDHENRRHLSQTEGYRRDWNEFLCEHIISVAYVELLTALKTVVSNQPVGRSLLEHQLLMHQSHFPRIMHKAPLWNVLTKACYQQLERLHADILPVVMEASQENAQEQSRDQLNTVKVIWYALQGRRSYKVYFPQTAEKTAPAPISAGLSSVEKRQKAEENALEAKHQLERSLIRCGYGLLFVTDEITDTFQKCDVEIHQMSPTSVLDFYRTYNQGSTSPCKMGRKLPAEIQNTSLKHKDALINLLTYCKGDPDFLSKLEGTPLLLTADQCLRVFESANAVYYTAYTYLFKKSSHSLLDSRVFEIGLFRKDYADCDLVKPLNIQTVSEMLEVEFPGSKLTAGKWVKWDASETEGFPRRKVVRDIWKFLDDHIQRLEAVQQLIPTQNQVVTNAKLQQIIKEHLSPMNQWAFIPANMRGTHYLVPLRDAHLVLGPLSVGQYIHPVLRGFKVPHTESVRCITSSLSYGFSEDPNFCLQYMVTSTDDVPATLNLLHETVPRGYKHEVDTYREKELLQYFIEGLEQLKTDQGNVAKLRTLPVYKTIHGKLVAMNQCTANILPKGIPSAGIETSQEKSGVVFLEDDNDLEPLFRFIGCHPITVKTFYCDFMFQHFEYFSAEERSTHLMYLYREYLRDKQQAERALLLQSMKQTELITDDGGILRQADYFYDQENTVFAEFYHNRSPPRKQSPFSEQHWRAFLLMLGMIENASIDDFLNCARIVASEGGQRVPGTNKRSKMLMEYLFQMMNQASCGLSGPNFTRSIHNLQQIGQVAFIEAARPVKDLNVLCPGYDGRHYIQIDGSIREEDRRLVWTQVPLLPRWADPKYKIIASNREHVGKLLGIPEQPGIQLVVTHLRTLTRHLQNSDTLLLDPSKDLPTRVFESIFEFLQNHVNDFHVWKDLGKEPCVMVEQGMKLVAPCQLVIDMPKGEQIKPFLYRLPSYMRRFQDIMVEMGTTEQVSAKQYAMALERMFEECQGCQLNPNRLRDVFKATKGIFTTLKGEDHMKFGEKLYLPSEKGILVMSSGLVYNDMPAFYGRVTEFDGIFLVNLLECGLDPASAEDGLKNVPLQHCPRLLSSMLEEVLSTSVARTEGQDQVARGLNNRIQSDKFAEAVKLLMQHELRMRNERLPTQTLQDLVSRLSVITVHTVKKVETVLKYKDGKQLVLKDSAMEKVCHVGKSNIRGNLCWKVYIEKGTQLTYEHIIPLAKVINGILDGRLHDSVLDLLPMLTCQEGEIALKLSGLNVQLGKLQSAVRPTTLPKAGSEMSYEARKQLTECSRKRVKVGDYVGYNTGEPARFHYATVLQIVDDTMYTLNLGWNRDPVTVTSGDFCTFESLSP